MTEVAIRRPCPVCLGARLEVVRPLVDSADVAVDRCPRCGGLWLELETLARVRERGTKKADPELLRPVQSVSSRCHGCGAALGRNAECCTACRRSNTLPCPECEREMAVQRHGELRFDRCRGCKAVWLDGHELTALWSAALLPLPQSATAAIADGLGGVVDVLDVADPAVRVVAEIGGEVAVGGVVELAGAAAGAAAEGAGAVGEAAAAVFEAVAGIVGSLG